MIDAIAGRTTIQVLAHAVSLRIIKRAGMVFTEQGQTFFTFH
jgi:hypothetical protein